MQPEDALKLVCSLLNPTLDRFALEGELSRLNTEEWVMLHQAAVNHGLQLLLYQRLKEARLLDRLPEVLRADLQERFLAATARNMRIFHQAGGILKALREAGVEVIVLKGLYLAGAVYPSIGLRLFGDIDLMVRQVDLERGLAVLQDSGYQLSTYYDPQDPNRDIKHLPPLTREGWPTLELHWNILQEDAAFSIPVEELWARAQPVSVAGVPVLTLDPEDLILHLCIHSSYQHGFRGGVRPLYDIAAVLQRHQVQVNWDKLAQTARQWGMERVLWLTLQLTAEIPGAQVPQEFLQGLADEAVDPSMLKDARKLLYSMDAGSMLTPDLAALQKLKTPGAKVRRVLERIFLSRRKMALQYNVDPHSLKVYGYYVVRLWDLLHLHGRSGWGLLRGEQGVLAGVEWEQTSGRLGEWMGKGKGMTG